MNSVKKQFKDQIYIQNWDQTEDQVCIEVITQVGSHVRNQIVHQVWEPILIQLWDQTND
jgi:hypothetical protein